MKLKLDLAKGQALSSKNITASAIIILAILAIGFMLIKGGAYWHPEEARSTYTYSDFLDGYYIVPQKCNLSASSNVSPELAERPNFLTRFSVTTEGKGGITMEMPADCLLNYYNDSQLSYWSQRNDPVAKFLLAYSNAKTDNSVCKRMDLNKRLLLDAVKSEISINGLNRRAKRVPESYAALQGIEDICRHHQSMHYYNLMYKEGYSPIDARPE